MQRITLAKSLVLLCLLALVLALQMSTRGADTSKDLTVTALRDAPSFAKRALVIGIDGYRHVPKLTMCVNDAHNFAKLLKTRFGFTDVVLMTDEPGTSEDLKPTYTNIRFQLLALKDGVVADQTEVVLFYSGHGVRSKSGQAGDADWLVPQDGSAGDIAGSCIDYTQFKNDLETKQPARALLVMDACRNLDANKGVGGSGFGGAVKLLGPQIAEILSCQPNQVSHEGEPSDFSESVFTHFLIAGLEGDKDALSPGTSTVTFDSLKLFVQGAVSSYVRDRFQGAVQVPDGQAKLGSMVLAKFNAGPLKVAPIDTTAQLHLHITPPSASVLVDGVAQSDGDIVVDLGTEKTRSVEIGVKKEGFRAKVQQVLLTRGESDELTVTLEPLPAFADVQSINPSADLVAINCGGPAVGSFIADKYYDGGTDANNNTGKVGVSGVVNPAPTAVYQTERWGDCTYTIPDLTPGAAYKVRLHFTEDLVTAVGDRVFNVTINDNPAITNFDIYAAAGALNNQAVIKDIDTAANKDGKIVISFVSVTQNAKVDGIEIIGQRAQQATVVPTTQAKPSLLTDQQRLANAKFIALWNTDAAVKTATVAQFKQALHEGADVNAHAVFMDHGGSDALIASAYAGRADLITLLVERGALVNTADNDGNNALGEATYFGHSDCVRMLIDAGADINARDGFGRTALFWAQYKEHKDIADMLKAAGAKE